jgi:hypothetical protein
MISELLQERQSVDIQIVAQYVSYAVITAMAFGVPWRLGLKNWKWFTTNMGFNKYVFWLHGTLTFSFMWLCQPRNLMSIFGDNLDLLAVLQCVMISLLAIVLWDFGHAMFWSENLQYIILVNLHHVGLFLAIMLGPGWRVDALVDSNESTRLNLEHQVSLDTWMFGHLWLIHSLGLIVDIILPYLFRIKLVQGQRSLKHGYALGSVYFYHQYMNSNLDKFFTYQTSSLFVMLIARYMISGNGMNVDFFRRIEFPGLIMVVIDRALGFHDNFCQRSLAIMVGLCGIYLVYKVFFVELPLMPTRYFGPEDNPELKKFLEYETDAVLGVRESAEKISAAKTKWDMFYGYISKYWNDKECKDGTKWSQKYLLHVAVALFRSGDPKDAEKFVNLIDKLGDKSLNEPMPDQDDFVPISFCLYQYNYECILILLKRGADPYRMSRDRKVPILRGQSDPWKLSGTGNPGALGFSDRFWERFNAICLKKSSPKVLSRREKFYEILKQF